LVQYGDREAAAGGSRAEAGDAAQPQAQSPRGILRENATGQPVNGKFHTQKAQGYLKNLQRIYRTGRLSEADKTVLAWLVDDLVHALLKCP